MHTLLLHFFIPEKEEEKKKKKKDVIRISLTICYLYAKENILYIYEDQFHHR
jgi:hypothetical protein